MPAVPENRAAGQVLRDAVIVRLCGGLGNQMFQYAAARALAARAGRPLRLDLRDFGRTGRRRPALHRWRIDAIAATPRELRAYPEWALWLARHALGLAPALRCYVEPALHFDAALQRRRPPLHLSGYFQCEHYFACERELLLQQFLPRQALIGAAAAWAQEAAASRSASIHVRRGDYVDDPQAAAIHGACGEDYYERAIEALLARTAVDQFFVFSDDLSWARSQLRLPGRAVFVDGHEEFPELDIHLMSRCRHHICANSSFSWWGAWLNPSPDKTVVAPARWFASPRLSAADLVPEAWVRV